MASEVKAEKTTKRLSAALAPATTADDQTDNLTATDKQAKDIHVHQSAELGRVPKPESVDKNSRILWEYLIPVIVFHIAAPIALAVYFSYLWSWWGLLFVPIGNYIFTSMGIGAGYHRLLTHRGFQCPKWFEYTLALLLSLIHI